MIKKELTLYLVTQEGIRYQLPIYQDVRYSQTFAEEQIRYKTLHNPTNYINGGFTTKLNPGSFDFTIPVMDSVTASALFTIFFKNTPESFMLYYIENGVTVRLDTCVLTQVTFNFQKDALITASFSGTYSYSDNTGLTGVSTGSLGTTYTYIQGIQIALQSLVIPYITNFSLEMSNSVEWVNQNRTMHNTTPPYPTEFYCSEKIISGNFSANQDLNIPSYYDEATLNVTIKGSSTMNLEFEFPSIIATTRPELADVIKKGFDFRVTGNTSNIINYKGVNII